MNIEISVGEVLDRLSILEIKTKEIKDLDKLSHINREILSLGSAQAFKHTFIYYYNLLLDVNYKIWNMTNNIKSINYTHSDFPIIANDIFNLNQSRFRLKNIINRLSDSNINEQKSYSSNVIEVSLARSDLIDLDRFTQLSLSYDSVIIRCDEEVKGKFELLVPAFNYVFIRQQG